MDALEITLFCIECGTFNLKGLSFFGIRGNVQLVWRT